MSWFSREAVNKTYEKPSNDHLPKVPQARKWIVEFLDGSVFEVWAHRKLNHDGVITFYKITGYWWRRNSLRNDAFRPWVASESAVVVAEIPTTAYKMIRMG